MAVKCQKWCHIMSQYQDAYLKQCAAARRYIILCSFPAECMFVDSDDDEEEESEEKIVIVRMRRV